MTESTEYRWYPGIEPECFTEVKGFVDAKKGLLESLSYNANGSNRHLNKVFWVYDLLLNEWLHDMPVVLLIDEDFLAICNYGLGGLSIGINNIDLARCWDFLPDYFSEPWLVEWREFDTNLHLPLSIKKCELIIDDFELRRTLKKREPSEDDLVYTDIIMGLAFSLDGYILEIVNGLDTNQIVIKDSNGQTLLSTLTDIG